MKPFGYTFWTLKPAYQSRKCFAYGPETGINDKETLKFDKVESWRKICLKYKKPILKPIVGFPLSTEFNNEISAGFKQTN